MCPLKNILCVITYLCINTIYRQFMAGIYIHIPFCRQACIYCNFHFSTQVKNKPALVDAILLEIDQRKQYLSGESIETIYFGGGTPSLLTEEELDKILGKIHSEFNVVENPEITLEANPDDLDMKKLISMKKSGINRLSIGVQSFSETELLYLNRAHNAQEALNCIIMAQKAGIDNISIDLIYGIPGQTDEVWKQNLETVKSLSVPHFSAYSLTVEPKTQLDHLIKTHQSEAVDDAQTAAHFLLLMQWAQTNGFEHYEISNFSIPGMYARHNSSYWLSKKYLGLGPSAHSYNGETRQWNISNNAKYIALVNENGDYSEVEILDTDQQFNEYVMTSLRTMWGMDLEIIKQRFGDKILAELEQQLSDYIEQGFIIQNKSIIVLTNGGKLLADAIMSDLFRV